MSTFPITFGNTRWIRRYGLTVVFIAVYCAMSLVIVLQGRTIESQRSLIRQLFHDSLELNALKVQRSQQRTR